MLDAKRPAVLQLRRLDLISGLLRCSDVPVSHRFSGLFKTATDRRAFFFPFIIVVPNGKGNVRGLG